MSPVIRPTRKDDVIALYGKPFNESFRGITAEMNGEVIGIAGVLHTSVLQAFSTITDELRRYPKTLLKAGIKFRSVLNSYDHQIVAYASKTEKNAVGFLKRVGFESINNGVFVWTQ